MTIAESLRASILQAAIEGKLTDQRAEDGDARDLLAKIQKEKQRLIAEKKIKKEKPLPPITADEEPFVLPENWCWVRLIEISNLIQYGYTASAATCGNAKLLRITDIQNNLVDWNNVPKCTASEKDIKTYQIENRDIVIARTGGTIGKNYIIYNVSDVAVFASYLIRVKPANLMNEKFLKIFMESPLYWEQLKAYSAGTGQPNVNGKSLAKLNIPLPPLAEQKRIVAKVETLMDEMDGLERIEAELTALKTNFPKDMKAALLQAAIQGKLTDQRAEDGDARDLLAEIQKEKQRLIAEKTIKKEKPLPPITADEEPFALPENWCWVRLGNAILSDVGGGTPSKDNSEYWNGDIPWMSVKDYANNQNGITDTREYITEKAIKESTTNFIKAGHIIVCTRVGLGKIAVNQVDIAINQDLRAIKLPEQVDTKYFLNWYKSLEIEGKGTTVKGISRYVLLNMIIPLPPLAEQKRIVARLEELLPLVDSLAES